MKVRCDACDQLKKSSETALTRVTVDHQTIWCKRLCFDCREGLKQKLYEVVCFGGKRRKEKNGG